MASGFIKISRDIQSHWLWKDADRFKWWLDLLMMAADEETEVLHGARLITLQPGQLIASLNFLCGRWHATKKSVRYFLNKLQTEGFIHCVGNWRCHFVIIEIDHPEGHSLGHSLGHSFTSDNQQVSTTEGHSLGHSLGHSQKEKERSKEKEKYIIKKENIISNNIKEKKKDEKSSAADKRRRYDTKAKGADDYPTSF